MPVERLIPLLESLHDEMRATHREQADMLGRVHPSHVLGATNLLDYLTLRSHDIRPLQRGLAVLGLSSLGRAEEHVITSMEHVLDALYLRTGGRNERRTEAAVGFGQGRRALEANAEALLGPFPPERRARILVTMPTEAADDLELVRSLALAGMDSARINCAHDDQAVWARMAANLHLVAREIGRPLPILMDLPGPKLRTGPVEPGPKVVRLRPDRDLLGRSIRPARAVLVDEGEAVGGVRPGRGGSPRIPVPAAWSTELTVGDAIRLSDTRGSKRTLVVERTDGTGITIAAHDTTYLATGTVLTAPSGRRAAVGELDPVEQYLTLRVDDVLTLTADLTPAAPEGVPIETDHDSGGAHDREDVPPRSFRIGCTLPEALRALEAGHRVFLDDGKIGGVVSCVRDGDVDVRIVSAGSRGSKLRAEKGINMPDTELHLAALGPEDGPIVDSIVQHADMVGISFAQHSADVDAVRDALAAAGGSGLGIVLKIETLSGFRGLPGLLLTAMGSERVGVMVARGDLAVECGFERLAELQEEILWLCDAAHIPVIWATQVLDQMAKIGQPSRAEISDAAIAGRAECVMLNKGPHIVASVSVLDDILCRMSGHQDKKDALLRRLESWHLEQWQRP